MSSLSTSSSVAESRSASNPIHKPAIAVPSWGLWYTGLAIGVATQILFLWTAYHLFLYLRYGGNPSQAFSIWIDLLLAIFFAWPHSLLLMPQIQKGIRRYLPAGWLGLLHCIATCVSLILLFQFWTTSDIYLWRFEGWANQAMLAAFYASWLALFYSLYLTGLGYQTGLIPWWHWLRGTAMPQRPFVTHGAFRYMRHPVYLSFLGLIWFTPNMTIDHAILTFIWTIYIYLGSYLKDRRLERFIGQAYREYGRRVAGFPIIGFGPWGKFSR